VTKKKQKTSRAIPGRQSGAKEATAKDSSDHHPARPWWLMAAMVVITCIVYAASLGNGFTNWDDEGYILKNELLPSIHLNQIFSQFVMGNYHPVTVMMQAIEYQIFGTEAKGYHTISLLLHLANSLLLFGFVLMFFRNELAAFIAALLFAIHPAHVESVSWVSAQKDLLYTGFFFASLIMYVRYVHSQRKRKTDYAWLLLFFLLSGLSKAQAVTLPVVLVLMDWYTERKIPWKQMVEKIPLFAISIVIGVVAIIAQKESESIQELEQHSFGVQLLFSFYALTQYLIRFVLPINLSAYYAYPERTGDAYPWIIYTSPVIVLIIGYLIFRYRNRQRELVFGSLFFLANIFLVLQLLPVGGAITADRYTYLSYAGLFMPLAHYADQVRRHQWLNSIRIPVLGALAVWLIFLAYTARARTQVWENSETLWLDAIRKNYRLPNAHNNLGSYYQKNGQLDLAKKHFDAALNLQPDFAEALINRCDYFRVVNRIDSALIDGNYAVRLDPDNVNAHQNRGIAFAVAGKHDSAMMDFQFVISREPENARAQNNLGNLYMMTGKPDSALWHYDAALRADPRFFDVLNNRGKAWVFVKEYDRAVTDLSKAIEVSPSNANNYYYRMYAYHKTGRKEEALADAAKAQAMGISIPPALMDSIRQGLQ
jgi:tetratricopeptide (TPR) repeat protein